MKTREPLTVSVVIPALNEERGIREVCQRLRQAGDQVERDFPFVEAVEILVVDDGSTDKTAELAASVDGVSVLSQENGGYGAALKAGFAAARGEWIAFLDADGTYPPEFLVDLVRELDRTDAEIILGSRMAGAESHMPAVRRAGNLFFARLLSWITGRSITDTASGMRIFKKDVLDRIDELPDSLDLTPAMSTSALHNLIDIREIPMAYDERVGGSKLNPVTDGLRFLWTILRTAHRYNPLKVFGLIGILLLTLGLAMGVGPVAYYVLVHRVEDWAIYRLIAVITLILAGIQIIFFGVTANVVMAATHRIPPFRNSLIARILLRPFVLRWLWLMGLLLMIGALALNHQGLYSFFSSGRVYVHWSYPLAGAMLFLLGLSLSLWGVLVRVVEKARLQAEARRAR